MAFNKSILSSTVLAAALAVGAATAAHAQAVPNKPLQNNSGTASPDQSDVNEKARKGVAPPSAKGPVSGKSTTSTTNTGTKTKGPSDVNQRARQNVPPPAAKGAVTTGGATNTNSGTKSPDATDVNERVRKGKPPQ